MHDKQHFLIENCISNCEVQNAYGDAIYFLYFSSLYFPSIHRFYHIVFSLSNFALPSSMQLFIELHPYHGLESNRHSTQYHEVVYVFHAEHETSYHQKDIP